MLNIANTTAPQGLLVPIAETIVPQEQIYLQLKSTMTHREYSFEVTDLQTSHLYYNIALQLPGGLDAGEYNYQLVSGDEILSSGLAIVGEYGREFTEYAKSIEYEQYEN